MINISFRYDLNQHEPRGMLMYKVQRKSNTRFYHQSNIDHIYANVIEEASKTIRLLIIWKIERSEFPKVDIMLVEYSNELVLSKYELEKLYDKVNGVFSSRYASTWLVCDNITLAAAYEVVRKEEIELKITISRGVKDKHIMNSMWIDSTR
jgi:hypothetical protein